MNFSVISLELGILFLSFLVLLIDLCLPQRRARILPALMSGGLLLLLLGSFRLYDLPAGASFFAGLYAADAYAVFFKQLFLAAMLLTIVFSAGYVRSLLRWQGEFYVLLLFALLGMCILASADDFLTGFVGLELMTISFYILVGMRMAAADASEAAVKYLLIGSASTAVMLYGVSLVYGMTGSLLFREICTSPLLLEPLGLVGIALILAGFFFKLAVIPFHMWAPDVYEGAPAPVSALLAMGSKAAGLAMLMRILYLAFPGSDSFWLPLFAVLSAICMIGGNILALRQTEVKRMLAYSSIAQAGYMLVGIAAGDAAGMKAVLFYAMLYVFANVGAFAVLAVIEEQKGSTERRDLAGLARSAPVLAAVMTVSLLSMAGIPPTAGFAGKLYLFTAVIEQGYLWLAFVGFVMSMISVYYYLLVAREMYLGEPDGIRVPVSGGVRASVLLSLTATLGIGICPQGLAELTSFAAQAFLP